MLFFAYAGCLTTFWLAGGSFYHLFIFLPMNRIRGNASKLRDIVIVQVVLLVGLGPILDSVWWGAEYAAAERYAQSPRIQGLVRYCFVLQPYLYRADCLFGVRGCNVIAKWLIYCVMICFRAVFKCLCLYINKLPVIFPPTSSPIFVKSRFHS